jgi:hypothetical protein
MTDHTAWVSAEDVPTVTGIHRFAELYPTMRPDEYATLKADIAANGQLEPVTLMPDGKILDGRHRRDACLDLGLEPYFVVFKGSNGQAFDEDALAFVRSKNSAHRHLTTSQRAMVAARMRKFAHLLATTRERALEHSVSKRLVEYADKVLDSGEDELIEEVDRGQVAVSAAAKRIFVLEEAEQERLHQAVLLRVEASRNSPRVPSSSVPGVLSFDNLLTDPPELTTVEDRTPVGGLEDTFDVEPYSLPRRRQRMRDTDSDEEPTAAESVPPSIAPTPPETPKFSDAIRAETLGLPDRDGVRLAAHYIEATKHGSESALYLFRKAAKRVPLDELTAVYNEARMSR